MLTPQKGSIEKVKRLSKSWESIYHLIFYGVTHLSVLLKSESLNKGVVSVK